jgi:hypothetical protein
VAALFGTDPYAAVLRVLRDAGSEMTAIGIKQALAAAGVPAVDSRTWDPLQRRLRADDHVLVEAGYRYRWVAEPVVPSAAEAFERIVRAAGGRATRSHVELVRRALTNGTNGSNGAKGAKGADTTKGLAKGANGAGGTSGVSGAVAERETATRQRQAVLDGLRALAELASEVEELTVNEASARAMIHRVRSRVKMSDLEPIERAGESVRFDRRRHELIGPPAREGATVLVVRPGYSWRTADEDVLVARAVVQE